MGRVLYVSSAGGHFAELLKLKQTMKMHQSFIVTEDIVSERDDVKIDYYLKYGSRSEFFKYLYIFSSNFLKSFKILSEVRPQVIVSTGAHSCVPFFLLGKIFGAKLIYIESYAKVNKPSLTYKLIKLFSDVIYVQHEEMLQVYPKAINNGGVY